MRNLVKFQTTAAYEAAESNLILPNVSLITETNGVAYKPSTPVPPTPSHEYVDLGLPSGTKWATMNVGASSITDYGNYYMYGKGADDFSVTSGESRYSGTESPLASSADTATQVWGGSWHTPTRTQLNELVNNTTFEWTTINGVNGGMFTAQNGNYVFLPAAGIWFDGSTIDDVGISGYYWTSFSYNAYEATIIHFGDEQPYIEDDEPRGYGLSVRPVMDA